MKYLPRTIEKAFDTIASEFKVVMISGLRGIGKRTLLKHLASPNRHYVTLEDKKARQTAEVAQKAFFKDYPLPVFIDEIQKAPSLFSQLKAEVDATDAYGQAWISGSQRFSLMQGVGESLVGRLFEVRLMPLSIYEREGLGTSQTPYLPDFDRNATLKAKTAKETWETIFQGAWPTLVGASKQKRERFFEAFVSTFLERDLREIVTVTNLNAYRRFLQAIALRTGQELRINQLARLAGVSEPTVRNWLSIAQASGLIYLLMPFSSNKSASLVKSPKLYMTDTGLAAWLAGFTSATQLQSDTIAGAFFETFVVTEILKSWRHNGEEPRLFFYRDAKKQTEIDLLIHADGFWHPVEITMTPNPQGSMIRHFKELENLNLAVGTGALICLTPKRTYLSETVIAHSVWEM
ncbi:MAG TPA: GTP-binding protein [Sutterella sp.]|nr:GTP-binding protein [Sutterella sp.]